MIAALAARRIVILDAPHGYQVELVPDEGYNCWDHWFEHHDEARAYAGAIFANIGWAVEDQSSRVAELRAAGGPAEAV